MEYITKAFSGITDIQDLEPDKPFVDNGGIYALKPEFVHEKNYYPPFTLPYVMPFWRSIDIDLKEDLELAQALYPRYQAYMNKK